jgi:hypothetical protein
MRQILDSNPERLVVPLAAIGGIARALDRTSLKFAGDGLPSSGVLAAATIVGALSGIIFVYLYGFLVHWTGGWFQGRGSAAQVRAALAWPNVIAAWALLLWIPGILLFGTELFTRETPVLDANPPLFSGFILFQLLELAVAAWFVVVFLKCVGEAQGFSAWKALANSVVAGLAMIAPFVILGIVIGLVVS